MSVQPIGQPIMLAGPQGPSTAAAQIASNLSTNSDGASVALDVDMEMLQKAFAATASAVNLLV